MQHLANTVNSLAPKLIAESSKQSDMIKLHFWKLSNGSGWRKTV